MDLDSNQLVTSRTARYFTLGKPDASKLLYVLHGYGQLASYFIRKFEILKDKGYYVVAPEGLHRFYLDGHAGRVGASWMTKEDRESDIEDYIRFLNVLHTEISQKNRYSEIHLLGFSQGVATAFRWLGAASFLPLSFLICSGIIPPDLSWDIGRLKDIKLYYVSGDEDPFRRQEEVQGMLNTLASHKVSPITIYFKGGHKVDINTVFRIL